jgi:hypothetical protein
MSKSESPSTLDDFKNNLKTIIDSMKKDQAEEVKIKQEFMGMYYEKIEALTDTYNQLAPQVTQLVNVEKSLKLIIKNEDYLKEYESLL